MAGSRSVPPIVSTEWLAGNADDPDLVVLDVRAPDAYEAGHVPGSASTPVPWWTGTDEDLAVPLPTADELVDAIGRAGIDADSRVVVVGAAHEAFPLADAANVADTLRYGGLRDVAVLDGGFDKWDAEGRPTTDESTEPTPVDYDGRVRDGLFVTKAELEERLGEVPIVDARSPEAYFGEVQEPFTDRAGHVPGATCLPAPWIWTEDGTYKSAAELAALAEGVVGADRSAAVILYCGASPFSKTWRYVLTELLDYEDATVYAGAAQEWTADPDAPLVTHEWE